ncbi:TPA: nuclease [bacterium]|nr:nuclease [bacterium]
MGSSMGSSQKTPKLTPANVTRVVDGDTIEVKIDNKTEKVKLIGVKCPESTSRLEPYGKESSNFTKKQLSDKRVYLEFDVQSKDKYLRTLAYVWLKQPTKITEEEIRSKMFNATLLLEGYAQVMTVPPNVKYVYHFLKFQEEAREKDKGLWGLETKKSDKTIWVYITETGKKYHRAKCRYLDKSCIEITLEEAKKAGYEPCKVCKPPE